MEVYNMLDASKLAGVSRQTLYVHVKQGRLVVYRDDQDRPGIDLCQIELLYGKAHPSVLRQCQPIRNFKISTQNTEVTSKGETSVNEIVNVFNYGGFNVRTVVQDGEPWFVAKDVCEILEIRNVSDALSKLDNDEKGIVSTDTLGGKQSLSHVSESGLYSLVMGSRKAEAKAFKKWVTSEVLPTIRKTGSYGVAERTIPQNFTEALRLAYEQSVEIDKLQIENKTQQLQLEEVKPKVDLHDSIMELEGLYLVDDVAKMLHFKVQTFRDFCRKEKVFILKNGSPSAAMIDKGYMEVKVTSGFNGINEWVSNVPYFTLEGISVMKRICNKALDIKESGGDYTCLQRNRA